MRNSSSVWIFFILLLSNFPVSGAERWEAEWEKTVKAARGEGQVIVYAFAGGPELPIEAGVFQKRYLEIKVVTVSGDPVPRILAERRAGKYIADVVIGGATTPWVLYQAAALDPLKDAMILPEVLDESKWWQGKHGWIDAERRYAFPFLANAQRGGIFYNTQLIRPNDFRSFWDFVNPKWKGKIQARDIRTAGPGTVNAKIFLYTPGLGPEFVKRLFGEMEITLFRDRRQAVDWLAGGKYAICFFCSSTDVGRGKAQGLPVDEFGEMKEGVGITSSGGSLGLANRAPHPNAAKVFVNWLLSREGQITVQTSYAKAGNPVNSRRIDIPKDGIPPAGRLREGVNYIEAETPERISMEPLIKIVNEALAEAERRKREH
jgi:iron(III) transport system substrate-binding protein